MIFRRAQGADSSAKRPRFSWVYLAPVLALLALSAWAFASPIGASPDDDYHLASVWCANEARTDLCAPDPVNGEGWRLVLPGITSAPCFVADDTLSGACQDWTGPREPIVAADHGNWIGAYPPVYYAVMNVFATTDVQASALVMRFVNVILYLSLMTALALLLPANLRVPLVAGAAITLVPLSGFLIASNNPGAWGVIGVGTAWISALGWFRSSGRRAWALGALTVISVLIAAGSRTDAAVYAMLGLAIAAFLAFDRTRSYGLKLILPAVLMIVAAAFFRASGYSAVAEGGLNGGIVDPESRSVGAVLAFNLVSIPQLWTGVFGSWGLGWRMEVWPGFSLVEFAALVVFIGLASLGLRVMPWRKAAMVIALVATLYFLPLYILTRGISVVGENVQPRYLVPLVVVMGALLLIRREDDPPLRPGRWHVIPAMVLLSAANSVALYTNLRRYITGFDVQQLSLDTAAEWWWAGLPIGPTAVWVFGSLAFTATMVVLGIAWLRLGRQHHSEARDDETPLNAPRSTSS
jgi:hypothetical protein